MVSNILAVLSDPFLWAMISMFGLVLASAVVAAQSIHKSRFLGFTGVALFALGRVVLTLPFCAQPRLTFELWHWIVGGGLFLAGMIFATPAAAIRAFTGPDEDIVLKTTGLYRLVRHPLYFGELLWSGGFALCFGSIIGLMLIPLWWLALLCLTLIEETTLERTLGEPYRAYRNRVHARIIPGLPI